MKKPEGVDIIIPIYNAYEDLQTCIASIFSCTDLSHHRLLLVNDASPDKRILPYIRSLENSNIIVIENENNLGFSGSINHGIRISKDRDVILLNSDTIVTNSWVEKIINCAYSAAEIATVTPLSNNATLCSVPEFLKENQLPPGFTLEQYANLIEMASLRVYPRIPVANGFCMYIKREVFDRIGLFDMETFGRGYGEENDFCYRAEQVGYCHVMCDDTYIYHTGTTSFLSDEKRNFIEQHEQILKQRYPEQTMSVAVHCRDNPNFKIQENIKLWTALKNGRGNVLYLLQSDFRIDAEDHLGGTQIHVKDLTSYMRKHYNIFVAARNNDFLNLTIYTEVEAYSFKFYIGSTPIYPRLRDIRFANIYGNILDAFQIDAVHIHHTKDITLEMFYEASKRHIPLFATLHDYYTICPTIKLIDYNEHLCCGMPNDLCKKCQEFFWKIDKKTRYIFHWQSENLKALLLCTQLFIPSESAKKIITNIYPELEQKLNVIPHGTPDFSCEPFSNTPAFNVAFLGGVSNEKGGKIAYKLIKHGPSDIKWHLFGIWGYNDLSMLHQANYITTGLYEREELPNLMKKYQIDLVCILSIWPETFCYTLSEAIQCHVPVIVTDIGALGERMKKLNCGWIVSVDHAYEETLEILIRIKDKGKEYQEKKERTFEVSLKTADDMGQQYLSFYRSCINKRISIAKEISKECKKQIFAAFMLGQRKMLSSESDLDEIQEHIQNLEKQLASIKTSFTYKCVQALSRIHIPCKKYLIKMLYIIYRKTQS